MSYYYETKRCRQTGHLVTVAHGDDLGLDTVGEGPWYDVCEEHGQICSHTSLALAKSFAADPLMWCSECQEEAEGLAPGTKSR